MNEREARAAQIDRDFRLIVDKEATARSAKTVRLRAARLAHEAQPAPLPDQPERTRRIRRAG